MFATRTKLFLHVLKNLLLIPRTLPSTEGVNKCSSPAKETSQHLSVHDFPNRGQAGGVRLRPCAKIRAQWKFLPMGCQRNRSRARPRAASGLSGQRPRAPTGLTGKEEGPRRRQPPPSSHVFLQQLVTVITPHATAFGGSTGSSSPK